MLRKKWNINPGKHVILTVCRLDKNKGVDVLLKALRALKEEDIEALISGTA
jgi:glycosyltransferase involved in cell wall biosynthesis